MYNTSQLGQQDAIIACHPLETLPLFDAETAGPRERSYATGCVITMDEEGKWISFRCSQQLKRLVPLCAHRARAHHYIWRWKTGTSGVGYDLNVRGGKGNRPAVVCGGFGDGQIVGRDT
ncbi:hypothetical protein QR685DRAFT_511823 [Neurospora intermedia]|uniref:Uncharacterized protein n=1 Tax=Neurospora intermedia TaxID=5142 RepID=A0ABR3DS10_NEUIN